MKSLSYKIGLGYVVLILINTGIAGFAIYHINRLGSPVERVLKENYRNASGSENMLQALKQQELAQMAMVEEGPDSALANQFHTYKNEFLNWHQRAIQGIALPEEPLLLDSIRIAYYLYLDKSDSLQAMLRHQRLRPLVTTFRSEKLYPLVNQLEALTGKLKSVNENAIRNADMRAREFSRRATLVIIIIAGLAVLLSIAAAVQFTQSILKPIKKTTETVRSIGQGNLNQKIYLTSNDEIAELAREFNKMTQRLQNYERMNINRILREKKKSEAIVSGIPAAIIVTDEEGRLSLMNDQAMKILEISGAHWQGKPISEVIQDQRLAQLIAGKHAGQQEKESSEGRRSLLSIKTKDGEELFFFSRQIEIRSDDHQAAGMVTLLQDVTRFKHLDRLKSEFIATISHEIKTPLTSVNMAVDILLREVKGQINPGQKELLSDVKADIRRLRDLVKELLDLSKLESGRYPLKFKSVTAPALIEDALKSLHLAIKRKHIHLQLNLDPQLPPFRADFHLLSRVITNLVQNAVDHTPDSGEVVIHAVSQKGQLQFCIEDTGEGIPEEAIDLIFDKFVQVKNFQEAEQGSIGLGLAIAREIVRAHGGDIWAESQTGQGSRFYFTIPLVSRMRSMTKKQEV